MKAKRVLALSFILLLPCGCLAGQGITLHALEKLALEQSPEIKQQIAMQDAWEAAARFDNTLPDPKLSVGALNVPTDSFSMTQENMTQMQFGLMQQFPKGDTLELKSKQDRFHSQLFLNKQQLEVLAIEKNIRLLWLDLYYSQQLKKIYLEQEKIFKQLFETLNALLAQNKSQQKDVIKAQYELHHIQQKIIDEDLSSEQVKTKILRWVQVDVQDLVATYPDFNIKDDAMPESFATHPMIKQDQINSNINQMKISMADQQYKPGYAVGLMYGLRQGDDSMGNSRSDFVGIQVSFDLPFFTSNRQDQKMAETRAKYIASQEKEYSDFKILKSDTVATMANIKLLKQQQDIYETQLLPEAELYTKATSIAYQNQQTDFLTLSQAYMSELKTRIGKLSTGVKEKKAEVNWLYIKGEAE